MVIKASSSGEIRSLVNALAGDDVVEREAAIARLAVIGSRAVDRLLAAYRGTTDPRFQTAVLRALEPTADPRVLPLAQSTLARGGDAAVIGVRMLHAILRSDHEPAATKALDVLVSTALNPAAERRVRVAALDALQGMPDKLRSGIEQAIRTDLGLSAEAGSARGGTADEDALWADALDGRLPDDPAALRGAAAARAASASPGSLRTLIDAVRVAEGRARPDRRGDWRVVRGALHQALALRGSRIAAYDLRETVENTREPLPPSFLAAIHAVGDASFIDPLAAALSRVSSDSALWRHQLASTFQAVARRERLTRRHAVIKRAMAKWPDTPLPL